MPKATRSDRTRLIARDSHSLHFGLSALPASQASVPGVDKETHDMLYWLNRWRANLSPKLFHLTYM